MSRTIEVEADINDFDDVDILAAADAIRTRKGELFTSGGEQDVRDLVRAIVKGDSHEALVILERALSDSPPLRQLVQITRARAA